MKTKNILLALSVASLALVGAANAATYTYDWVGGDPGYAGTLVLDAPASPSGGGSANDIVSLSVTTPANGTINLDTVDWVDFGYPQLIDTTFTWNASQVTEMAVFGYDASGLNTVTITENAFGGGGNQAANELNNFGDIDTGTFGVEGGSWVAVANAVVPEPATILPGVFAVLAFGVSTLLRARRRNYAA